MDGSLGRTDSGPGPTESGMIEKRAGLLEIVAELLEVEEAEYCTHAIMQLGRNIRGLKLARMVSRWVHAIAAAFHRFLLQPPPKSLDGNQSPC